MAARIFNLQEPRMKDHLTQHCGSCVCCRARSSAAPNPEPLNVWDKACREAASTQATPFAAPSAGAQPCKHEEMWFSRTIEADGMMHNYCAQCGMRDVEIEASATPTAAPEQDKEEGR
jgi:hypothetical protein